jgi:hypothetical protein
MITDFQGCCDKAKGLALKALEREIKSVLKFLASNGGPQRWQGEMEKYVTGGAVGVYEKGGAEEMEPGEAAAVRVLILSLGPSRGRCPHPGCKIHARTFDALQRRSRT